MNSAYSWHLLSAWTISPFCTFLTCVHILKNVEMLKNKWKHWLVLRSNVWKYLRLFVMVFNATFKHISVTKKPEYPGKPPTYRESDKLYHIILYLVSQWTLGNAETYIFILHYFNEKNIFWWNTRFQFHLLNINRCFFRKLSFRLK